MRLMEAVSGFGGAGECEGFDEDQGVVEDGGWGSGDGGKQAVKQGKGKVGSKGEGRGRGWETGCGK